MQVNHNSIPLRVGFLGAGFIAQTVHLPAFAAVPDITLAAICDPRHNLAQKVAQQFSVPRVVASVADIFNDPELDAFVVCVHRRCLAPLVEAALKTGKPVLSEKPMAYSVEQARRLLVASTPQQIYAVGMMKRFDAGVRRFREILTSAIASDELGDIIHVEVSDFSPTYGVPIPPHLRSDEEKIFRYEEWSRGPSSLDPAHADDYEYTLNVASHDINLARWLFGDDLAAQSLHVRSGRMQSAVLTAPAFDINLQIGRSDSGVWDQVIKVWFRRGRMELRLASPLARAIAEIAVFKADGTVTIEPRQTNAVWAFAAQATHFVSAARGQVLLEVPGGDSLSDIELIEGLWAKVMWRQ
ncbi:MAG: Gfo/Idh/MocA family protein [Parvibaculaceae bacterium]